MSATKKMLKTTSGISFMRKDDEHIEIEYAKAAAL